jgi:transposase
MSCASIIIYLGVDLAYNIDLIQLVKILKSKTIKEAAVHLGVSYGSLYYFCKKNSLKSSMPSKGGRPSTTEQYVEEVVNDYLAGMSQQQIAKKFGIAKGTVQRIVKLAAHHMRTRSEAARLRDARKTDDELKQQAAAANAVRMAMGIINRFG